MQKAIGEYTISDDAALLDVGAMHDYLSKAYWSEKIPRETLERAVRGSLCIGAYDANRAQVGLARFVSDFATFCYVCDVYVLEAHRNRGLAAAMMALAIEHPRMQGMRRWVLVTRDAHPLYRKFGFTPIANVERYMERFDPAVYRR